MERNMALILDNFAASLLVRWQWCAANQVSRTDAHDGLSSSVGRLFPTVPHAIKRVRGACPGRDGMAADGALPPPAPGW
jgi:hypothetical protein